MPALDNYECCGSGGGCGSTGDELVMRSKVEIHTLGNDRQPTGSSGHA
jgi:hypothetical protein